MLVQRATLIVLGLLPIAATWAQDPYPSTYRPADNANTLIRDAIVLTGDVTRIDNGDVLIIDGRAIPMRNRQTELRDRHMQRLGLTRPD